MSGGGKKLTTSQRVFAISMLVDSTSKHVVDQITDLERLIGKTTVRDEKRALRAAVELMGNAHLMITKAQNTLHDIMSIELEEVNVPKRKPKKRKDNRLYNGPM